VVSSLDARAAARPLFRTILVPTDFSACARRAVEYAADLARASGAALVLHHATELPLGVHGSDRIHPEGVREAVRIDDYARRSARAHLDAEAARIGDGVRVITRADIGPTSQRILDAAQELGADLIVMGTHGRTGLRRGLMGSIAERVVRAAVCPVLTLRIEDRCADPLSIEEHRLLGESAG
jgi:universal stress protein A